MDGLRARDWGQEVWIPIMCLRWTHDGIQSSLRFSDRKTVMDLVLELWREGFTWTNKVPPLDVVLDEAGCLWCLSNRRLAAYRMLQALSAKTVWAKCVLGPRRRKFYSSKTTENMGTGVVPHFLAPSF